ncbi:hypothetical protein NIES267_19470 [Calothrix parasitica NIES-267]|uniref:Uncharacterized protein n=1 Tax=Calothrix parasitica NIES-267 TaxID=1973488 RepID=A0A1Z4LMM5_9CYAN|nr:hypothetical protein NIES267_19470 [Calothrix parasitica NIES-267]
MGRLGDWEIGRLGDWEIGRLGDWGKRGKKILRISNLNPKLLTFNFQLLIPNSGGTNS